MTFAKMLLTSATACTWMALCSVGFAASTPSTSDPSAANKATYGTITLLDSKGEFVCTMEVPEKSKIFNFSDSNEKCENNKAASFTLDNIPSATKIGFFAQSSCSDAHVADNFYVKLKTVKQPTTWETGVRMNFNELRGKLPGDLIPNKFIRVEGRWQGHEFENEDWDEQISCAMIERSQPAN